MTNRHRIFFKLPDFPKLDIAQQQSMHEIFTFFANIHLPLKGEMLLRLPDDTICQLLTEWFCVVEWQRLDAAYIANRFHDNLLVNFRKCVCRESRKASVVMNLDWMELRAVKPSYLYLRMDIWREYALDLYAVTKVDLNCLRPASLNHVLKMLPSTLKLSKLTINNCCDEAVKVLQGRREVEVLWLWENYGAAAYRDALLKCRGLKRLSWYGQVSREKDLALGEVLVKHTQLQSLSCTVEDPSPILQAVTAYHDLQSLNLQAKTLPSPGALRRVVELLPGLDSLIVHKNNTFIPDELVFKWQRQEQSLMLCNTMSIMLGMFGAAWWELWAILACNLRTIVIAFQDTNGSGALRLCRIAERTLESLCLAKAVYERVPPVLEELRLSGVAVRLV